ncbi:hypothetical protein SANTM175S_04325 [Streptomyces antimycoticus]
MVFSIDVLPGSIGCMPDFTEMSGQGGTGPVVTVGTDSVPAPERLGWWSEMVDHEVMPVAVHSAHTAVFRGRAEAVELPHSQVTAFDFSPITAHRSPAHIRRQDPENYYLLLVRDSSVRLEQALWRRLPPSGRHGPAAIAAHHHVSVRTLHLLFHSEPETVSARIRRRRLEHCHADLTDPRLRRRSISAIAARWGFLRPADFSRAFRAAYGVAPRELRQAALRSLPDARRVARSDK